MRRVPPPSALAVGVGLATLLAILPAAVASAPAASAATAGTPATPATAPVPGSQSPAATPATAQAAVPTSTAISFDVTLNPRDAAGAAALAQAVSDPTSASYKHYITAAQWESEFSPTVAQVAQVTSWLAGEGLTVGGVSPDQLSISVSGTAAQINRAFGTTLRNYSVQGRSVQMTSSAVSVPTDIAGLVQGTPGLDQVVATPAGSVGNGSDLAPATTGAAVGDAAVSSQSPIPQPAGYRNATPCSAYYGQLKDTTDPTYGAPYAASLPYAVCGYTPQQLESAYGLSGNIGSGIDGQGQTVAIVDAYESPTLFSDAQHYYALNDPAEPLEPTQFSTDTAKTFDHESLCGASGWSGEQTLDVEAVHAMAPGANILFVGAENCLGGLLDAERQVVDNHLADIVSNSWGDNAGDLLDSPSDRASYDTVFELAIATGISVLFAAGDDGDEFTTTGLTSPDYPPSSPFVTAVGGTSLAIGATGARTKEVGWSTSKSDLCTAAVRSDVPGCTTALEGTYVPAVPGGYDYGGGGGTSFDYLQPYYQAGVVPVALSERNSAVLGPVPTRVEPDISMDADPTTGFLIGETQSFPGGVKYGQYRIGGTSLATPLMAGVVAEANQVSGSDLGFINPALYKLDSTDPGALFDVVPRGTLADVRQDYVNSVSAKAGIITSVRTLGFEGLEQYCDGASSCEARDVALSTAPGFDSMTGLGAPDTGFVQSLAGT